MSYDDYKRKVIDAQEQWNKDRDWIYKTEGQGNYGTEFSGDVQNPSITSPDSYDHMDLATMQQSVDAMKPKMVDDAVTAWANIGATLTGTFSQFQQQFAHTVATGWRGTAAKAAVDAVNNYSGKSTHLASAATLISLKLSEMKTGLEETQALMPGATTRPDLAGKTLPTDGVLKVDDHNQQEATQEARRILTTVYGPVAGQTDTGVPYLPTPPQIASGPVPPVGPSGPNQNSVQHGGATGPGGTKPGADKDHNTDGGASGAQQSASGPSSTASDSTNPNSKNSQNSSPATQSTTTAGYDPTASAQQDLAGTGGAPGSSTGGSAPGFGGSFSPGGSQSPESGGPGRSAPGAPGLVRPAAAAATTSAANRAGMPGMSGMNPGQGKGKGEDTEKSGVPEYLVTKEHGDELTGLDGRPKAVPPVIGGDFDAPKY